MRVLILIAHADPQKIATAYRIANAAQESLTSCGHEVRVVDLISEGFDKVMTMDDFIQKKTANFDYPANYKKGNLVTNITAQHDNIMWCTNILIIGPIWCYKYPACLYSYIERVLTDIQRPNVTVSMVISVATGPDFYTKSSAGTLEQFLYSVYFAFNSNGYKITRPLGFYNAGPFGNNDKSYEERWISSFKKAVLKLDNWEPWDTNSNKPAATPDSIVK